MNRRFFLKGVGIFVASTIVPDFRLILPDAPLLPDERWFALIRELAQYDVKEDYVVVRWDILSSQGTQLFVSQSMEPGEEEVENMVVRRKDAAFMLAEEMRKRGIDARELKPLPIPYGCNRLRAA